MKPYRILLSLLIAASAGLFALRHHSLRQLNVEHDQLEQQTQEATNQAAAIPAAPVSSTNADLSAAERSELLRLRGQVGSLRQELIQASNELANVSRPMQRTATGPDGEPIVTRAEAMRKMAAGKQWMLALILYAENHQRQLPGTLAEAMPFAGADKIEGADYEFVRTNLDLTSVKSPATTIVLRESTSWKTYNGKWNRSYAFADGHVENATSDTNDFTEWEAKHQAQEQATGQ